MKEYKLRVNLTVKRLLDCPLDGRSLYVKIKWAPRAMWGGKMDYTSTKPSQNRTIEWNETFTYECYVLLDTADTSHEEDALAKLRKKQDRMAYLRLSLRKEKVGENPIAARKRKLGFVDIPLVDWAILYGNQKEHNIRHLLDGTMSTTRLELAVYPHPCCPCSTARQEVLWVGGMPGHVQCAWHDPGIMTIMLRCALRLHRSKSTG
jgi:hypothetical protein